MVPSSASTMKPGAVPTGFSISVAPSGINACCRLLSVISVPKRAKRAQESFQGEPFIANGRRAAAAIACLVMSSAVGQARRSR